MDILFGILSALASDISYLLAFVIVYSIIKLLHWGYRLIGLKNNFIWIIDGILTGTFSIFIACYVAYLILRNHDFSELSIIITFLLPVLIGETGYYRYLTKNSKTYFLARLHHALKYPTLKGETAYYETILTHRMSSGTENKQKFEGDNHNLRKEAYEIAKGILAYIALWNLVGYIIGLYLFHHFIF